MIQKRINWEAIAAVGAAVIMTVVALTGWYEAAYAKAQLEKIEVHETRITNTERTVVDQGKLQAGMIAEVGAFKQDMSEVKRDVSQILKAVLAQGER